MGHIASLRSDDGRAFDAFLESPERPNGHGIVLLPEVYNVNQWVRRVAARYAREGFTVLVPDLFWRQQPGCHYEYDHPDAARAQGEHVDVDAVVRDVGTAAARLRETLGAHARVGAVGYCLGGRLALLAGTREPVDAVVSYYGVKLDQHLDELARLAKPAQLHFGDADPWVPNDVVHAVQARMAGLANAAIHVYEGAGHAFDRDGQPTYRAQAADLAWRRTLALLASAFGRG